MRSGEPGHVWVNDVKRRWPPVHLLADGDTQRTIPGPLLCANCTEPWPGTGPCFKAPR